MATDYTEVNIEDEDSTEYGGSSTSKDFLLEKALEPPTAKESRLRTLLPHLAIHACYIAIYSIITFIAIRSISSGKNHGAGLIFTPARNSKTFEVHPAMGDYEMNSPYFGKPSPTLDRKWLELLQYSAIRITKDEFAHYNKEGILLGDDSGYLATLTMYHDLHCIRYLQQVLYPEYYFPNQTEKERLARREHSEHCLMNLKHAVTCGADITVRTMQWNPNQLLPIATDNPHECANWDSINEWMKSRSIDAYKPGMLVHPTLGPAFPNGYTGDKDGK